jgi:nucleoside-diphosphate-sugar epimerase
MAGNGNRTALVLGATGGIGGAVAEALGAQGWRVRALVRNPGAAAAAWRGRPHPPAWVPGDAMSRDDVTRAAEGAAAIVHAVNPPGYRGWDRLVLPMIDNTIAAARAVGGARVVLPGTIYNHDPARTPVIDEDTPQEPRTRKGAIRVELERRLGGMSAEVPALVVRAGDFFGPRSRASWFGQAMVKPGRPVRGILHPGPGVGHAWAYLPDLAETIVRLMGLPGRLRPFERIQFQGHWDADGTAMVAAIRRAAGVEAPVRPFPWWLLRMLAPFGGFPREAAEIEPYWRHPVRLDNRRLVELLGAEPRTPIDEAVAATLAGLGCIAGQRGADALLHAWPEAAR